MAAWGATPSPSPLEDLDELFEALAHKHRREIVRALSLRPSSISQLAAMRGLSLPAMHKHVRVLEAAEFVSRRKMGRTTFLTLNREALRRLQGWLGQFHAYCGAVAKKPSRTTPPI
ncbi:MAG: ArsR family transcriptional regulator [Dehalococcoidia bacterium]|nr:ArsR family transcriptional regulator [Dehalococcoidia bacterium]